MPKKLKSWDKIFNQAIASALEGPSALFQEEILPGQSETIIYNRSELATILNERYPLSILVAEIGFHGVFSGRSFFLVHEQGMKLFKKSLDNVYGVDELPEEELLEEVGNISLNSYMAVVSNMAKANLVYEVPRVVDYTCGSELLVYLQEKGMEEILCASSPFNSKGFLGEILVIFEEFDFSINAA